MKLIDNATRESVRKLTDYLHEDEEKHYEESESADRAGHIFTSVQVVESWLDETREGQASPRVKITPFDSPRSNRPVANQWVITTDDGEFFQSYRSLIAFKPYGGGKVVLDTDTWDYSTTTGKYRNEFLGEGIAETRAKIASGEYLLANLNQK